MFIKASGVMLSDLRWPGGFAELPFSGSERHCSSGSIRPSIEHYMHAVMGRVVIHAHPTPALRVLCRRDSAEYINRRMKGLGCRYAIVPYANPGEDLAKAVNTSCKEIGLNPTNTPLVLFLENHGVVASNRTVAGSMKLMGHVITRLGDSGSLVQAEKASCFQNGRGLAQTGNGTWVQSSVLYPGAEEIALSGAFKKVFFPDQAVYLGPEIPYVPIISDSAMARAEKKCRLKWGCGPFCILGRSGGFLIKAGNERELKAREDTLMALMCVLSGQMEMLRPLPPMEVARLLVCEGEKFRMRKLRCT
jgi:hypothetical protein